MSERTITNTEPRAVGRGRRRLQGPGRPRTSRPVLAVAVLLGLSVACGTVSPPVAQPSSAGAPALGTPVADLGADEGGAGREVPSLRDLRYGSATGCPTGGDHEPCGGSQTLDVFDAPGSAGTVVFVHGGGFTGGDKSHQDQLEPFLRQRDRGWDVVSVNYRLADRDSGRDLFPAAVLDVAAAVEWVRTVGTSRYGLDVSRVVVAGHSAGATIATLLAVAANSQESPLGALPPVHGFVALSGIHDFAASPYWGRRWFPDDDLFAVVASPVTWVDAGDPPGLVVHGDRDTMVGVANAFSLAQAAATTGVPDLLRVQLVTDPAPEEQRGHWPAAALDPDVLGAFLAGV